MHSVALFVMLKEEMQNIDALERAAQRILIQSLHNFITAEKENITIDTNIIGTEKLSYWGTTTEVEFQLEIKI